MENRLEVNLTMNAQSVPKTLRIWFVIHFILDILVAVPLMIAPIKTLYFFGWDTVDPISTRIVAAALFGIGIESFLGRNSGLEAYRGMLTLKIIWSFSAVIGILLSLLQSAQGKSVAAWLILLIFAGFNLLWVYWRLKIKR